MIKLERILCPTDLSEDSERTIRYAVAIARAPQGPGSLFVIVRNQRAEREEALVTIQKIDRGIHTLFGSNVDRVLRQARCPLLVAHPIQASQNAGATA